MEFKYKNTTLIEDDDIKKEAEELQDYLSYLNDISKKKDYSVPESSMNLPFDSEMQDKIKKIAEKLKSDKLKYVVVIGIGGSNLGALAVYEALYGKLDYFLKDRLPKVLFADTTDPVLLNNIKEILEKDVSSPEEVIVNIISKSGTTTETIANFEVISGFLKERFNEIKERVVVTTDYQSKIWTMAEEKGFTLLEIPKTIVGSYSVFSAVGLFPLMLSGVDTGELLKGAQDMRNICLNKDVFENPALISAILLYFHNKKGININDNFFFIPDFESLGKWYRHLMAESVGKEQSTEGEVVNAGITPTVSIGSTDLHSMIQLYLGGPKDKFTCFVCALKNKVKVGIPKDLTFPGLVSGVENKKLDEIMSATFKGVKQAYQKKSIPFAEVVLQDISAGSVGEYLEWKMIEIMFLAKLFKVNAFDQPNVEEYKEETRKILESK